MAETPQAPPLPNELPVVPLRGAVVLPIGVLFADTTNKDICNQNCPPNPILVTHNTTLGDIAVGLYAIVTLLVLAGAVVLLLVRWRRAPAPERRLLGPLYLTGGATLSVLLLSFVTDQAASDSVPQGGLDL